LTGKSNTRETSVEKSRILLVEDEPNLAFNLKFNLSEEGYEVVHESRGDSAKLVIKERIRSFDLAILDVMLPGVDGFELAKTIREFDPWIPILMLTARTSEEDRMFGLGLKVDDYISKPFHLGEFLLKAKRAVERAHALRNQLSLQTEESPVSDKKISKILQPSRIVMNGMELDSEAQTLTIGGEVQDLTEIEAKILRELMAAPGKILSREYLLTAVWGRKGQQETRTVDAFIVRVRKLFAKVKNHPSHEWIRSIRGRGYLLVPPEKKTHEASAEESKK
jgi:DNA-binding response OmpR family regulator